MLDNLKEKMRNKSIRQKLYLGFSAMIAQATAAGVFCLLFMTLMYFKIGSSTVFYFIGVGQLLFFMAVAFFIMICVGKRIVEMITQPLEEIKSATEGLAEGNLHVKIDYVSEDEIGQMAQSLRESLSSLSSYVEDISRGMAEFADGNYTVKPSVEMKGDFEEISNAMFSFEKSITDTVLNIRNVATQVSNGASQVADSSTELAQGATEQAGVTEELTASIEAATAEVVMSAEAAKAVSKKVENSGIAIGKSNEKVQEMVASMNEISEASKKIQTIIDAINGIAAQTNLLALNASIEAARAGEAGKGFAVVADQVSVLASQSSDAARESNTLIEASLVAVEKGTLVAHETAEQLHKVVVDSSEITEDINHAAEALRAQAESFQQIVSGVVHINDVVQMNSATSQECAAASEEMSSQAEMLESLMQNFKVEE